MATQKQCITCINGRHTQSLKGYAEHNKINPRYLNILYCLESIKFVRKNHVCQSFKQREKELEY